MIYENRTEAAVKLIPHLEKFRNEHVLILAIPRGAVPMGKVIADYFGWELGLLFTKKIGHPDNLEYAIGAVNREDVFIDPHHTEVSSYWIDAEVIKIRKLLEERKSTYLAGRKETEVRNRTVIIVDDGIATGFTMKASVELLRKQHPSKIVIAVPVASPSSVQMLRQAVDELIVIDIPDNFMGVGQFYEEFDQVTDEEVVAIMNESGMK